MISAYVTSPGFTYVFLTSNPLELLEELSRGRYGIKKTLEALSRGRYSIEKTP
jgi:hypothetical protein